MRASRRYFTTLLAAAVTLCTFLGTFIILAMTLASAIVGPQFLNTAAYTDCGTFRVAAPGLPCPKEALNLYKISQVLGAFSLACLFFGYVFSTLGLADLESDATRDNYSKNVNGYYNPHSGYAEVVSPTLKFWLATLFTALGVMLVLAAVSSAVASSVTKHDWAFKTVCAVLSFAAVAGSLVLFAVVIMRRENQPIIAAQPLQQYNVNQPIGGGPAYAAERIAPASALP